MIFHINNLKTLIHTISQKTLEHFKRKMKLTGLSLDCLESILEYLEFGDLLNVASANKRLNTAADFIYIQNHRQKSVRLRANRVTPNRFFTIETENIAVDDLKTCLQLVRCFGRFIRRIFCSSELKQSYILNYINEYCSESLSEIELKKISKGHLNVMNKPFARVETMSIEGDCLDVESDWIQSIFQQIKHLTLDIKVVNLRELGVLRHHFQYLEYLNIRIGLFKDRCGIYSVTEMFHKNPQLKVFSSNVVCPTPITAKFIQNAYKYMQNVETLEIGGIIGFFENFNDDLMHFRSVKNFVIDMCTKNLRPYIIRYEDWEKQVPFSFERLESLNLRCFQSEFRPLLYRIIRKNSMIKKLTIQKIRGFCEYKNKEMTPLIAGMLLSLEELDFDYNILSVNFVIEIIAEIKSLKIIAFAMNTYGKEKLKNLLESLQNTWKVKCHHEKSEPGLERIILERQQTETTLDKMTV